MKPRRHLTPAEKRVLSAVRMHGPAVRVWSSNRQDDYSWWIAGQPVTRIVHSLAVKGYLRVEEDKARLTARDPVPRGGIRAPDFCILSEAVSEAPGA